MTDVALPVKAEYISARGWRLALALFSGILASASLPPLNYTVLICALSLPALGMASAGRGREAFFLGWATGFGWFLLSLSWVSVAFITSGGGHVFLIPFAAAGLPLLLGVFWAAAFMLAWRLSRHAPTRILMLIVFLPVAEYIRGVVLSGFPWNTPGMIVLTDDRVLGIVAYTGIWGATLLAVLFAMMPALIRYRQHISAGLAVILLTGFVGLGFFHHNTPAGTTRATGMTARLVQPNIPQGDKWIKEKRPGHLRRLALLSADTSAPSPDVIIWPESAFAGMIEREGDAFRAAIAASSDQVSPVLTGVLSLKTEDGFRLFNTAVLADPEGRVTASYSKTHLVPFGEYAPGRGVLPFVEAIAGPIDFSSGEGPAGFSVRHGTDGAEVTLAPLICYEIIFPALVRKTVLKTGADVLVNITNDAWFGDTIGPRQHLAMARLRAAELGLPVLRVANTGISAGIDSHGRITDQIAFGQAGMRDVALGGALDTFYRRHGDLIWWLMLMAMGFWAMASSILTRSERRM